MRKSVSLFVVCMLLIGVAGTAQATVFTVYATDAGWFDSSGVHNSTNDNYAVGRYGGSVWNDFFTFNIPPLDGPVVSAVLQASNPAAVSQDATETYAVYDYTLANSLHIDYAPGAPGTTIYAALGSGTSYGSVIVNTAPPDDPVVVALNASGWGDIFAAQGTEFAIGGTITTLSGTGADESMFGFSQGWQLTPGTGDDPVLTITTRTGPQEPAIPEPATLALLGAGILTALRRRSRR